MIHLSYIKDKIKQKGDDLEMGKKEKVTKVIDGDTFRTSIRKRPVRLANFDAPGDGDGA